MQIRRAFALALSFYLGCAGELPDTDETSGEALTRPSRRLVIVTGGGQAGPDPGAAGWISQIQSGLGPDVEIVVIPNGGDDQSNVDAVVDALTNTDQTVAAIGHSFGGDVLVQALARLEAMGVTLPLVILVDPVRKPGTTANPKVPDAAATVINYYSNCFWLQIMGALFASNPAHTRVVNVPTYGSLPGDHTDIVSRRINEILGFLRQVFGLRVPTRGKLVGAPVTDSSGSACINCVTYTPITAAGSTGTTGATTVLPDGTRP